MDQVVDEADANPAASGVRIPWSDVPEALRTAVETALEGQVVEAVTQSGGFSPGVAARLRLADGRRFFVKAVSAAQNPESPDIHRSEARIAAALPASVPAPRLLASFDEDGWVVLVFEDVDGAMPAQPWQPDELARVADALACMAEALNPAPIDVPTAAERFGDSHQGWRLLAASDEDLSWLERFDPWALRNLERLAELEPCWEAATGGTGMAHADVRADNLLLTPDRVMVVDWPWACTAAPWFDLVAMVPSVWMQAGPEVARLLIEHELVADAEPETVTALLVALAGYFVHRGHQPPPPGLPTLRAFQRAQGVAALAWLKERLPWE